MEPFYIINKIPKINRAHWNLPSMSCILKFRSLKISLETLEHSFHNREKTEICREASWDIWNSPLSVWLYISCRLNRFWEKEETIVLHSIAGLMLINDQFFILAPINFSAKSCSLAGKLLRNNKHYCELKPLFSCKIPFWEYKSPLRLTNMPNSAGKFKKESSCLPLHSANSIFR